MEVLLFAVLAVSNILCFIVGAKVGQKVTNDEKVELPSVNPLHAYQKMKDKQEAQKERNMVNTILRNIDSYDGTPEGQEDVPM